MSDEAPGVNLKDEPLSVVLAQKLIGRTVVGLAEAILFYQREGGGPAAGDSIRELAEHLSLLGLILTDQPGPPSRLPEALVVRLAGRLEKAADQQGVAEGLAVAWRRDAMRLCAASGSACRHAYCDLLNLAVLPKN